MIASVWQKRQFNQAVASKRANRLFSTNVNITAYKTHMILASLEKHRELLYYEVITFTIYSQPLFRLAITRSRTLSRSISFEIVSETEKWNLTLLHSNHTNRTQFFWDSLHAKTQKQHSAQNFEALCKLNMSAKMILLNISIFLIVYCWRGSNSSKKTSSNLACGSFCLPLCAD